MSRCKAMTRKGTQCLNMAMEGSEYCNVHADREEEAGAGGDTGEPGGGDEHDVFYEMGEATRKLLGAAVIGGAILLAFKLGRRW